MLYAVLFDKGCVVNSIYNYPTNLVFFTTPELLEIGDIPMTSLNEKPGKDEALKYYRRVADHYNSTIQQYEPVLSIEGDDGDFAVETTDRHGLPHDTYTRARWFWRPATTTSPTASMCRARTSKGYSLLQGRSSVLQPRRAGGGRKELGGDRGTGTVLDGRARHDGPPRRRDLATRSNTGSSPILKTVSRAAKSKLISTLT